MTSGWPGDLADTRWHSVTLGDTRSMSVSAPMMDQSPRWLIAMSLGMFAIASLWLLRTRVDNEPWVLFVCLLWHFADICMATVGVLYKQKLKHIYKFYKVHIYKVANCWVGTIIWCGKISYLSMFYLISTLFLTPRPISRQLPLGAKDALKQSSDPGSNFRVGRLCPGLAWLVNTQTPGKSDDWAFLGFL